MSTEVPEPILSKTRKRRRRRKKPTSPNSALYTEVRIGVSWSKPKKLRSLAVTLINKIFHEPEEFSSNDLLLLSEVHRRLDAFCRLTWVPFIYRHTLLAVNEVLQAHPDQLCAEMSRDVYTDMEAQYHLTMVQWLVVEDRQWTSRRATYLRAVARKELQFVTSSVEARIERHLASIPRPRVRGYRDHGTLRPRHKWLPPAPPDEEGYRNDPNPQADLEDFRRSCGPSG